MPTWNDLMATANQTVDDMFGVAIRLLPYNTGGYLSDAQPDNSREARDAIGVPMSKEAMMKAAGTSSFISRRLDADELIEIQERYVGDTRANDRLTYNSAPDVMWEIAYIEPPNHNGYRCLHLMTVKDT